MCSCDGGGGSDGSGGGGNGSNGVDNDNVSMLRFSKVSNTDLYNLVILPLSSIDTSISLRTSHHLGFNALGKGLGHHYLWFADLGEGHLAEHSTSIHKFGRGWIILQSHLTF